MGSSVRRVVPPTEEQVAALADAMPGVLRAFTLTAAYSGLRLFEVAALRREDVEVDVFQGVGRIYVRSGKGPRANGGKGKPRYTILLEPGLSALLAVPVNPSGLAFRNSLRRPWTRQSVNRHWQTARREAGLPGVMFRDLRPHYATLLLDRGVSDLDVAIALGHTDWLGRPDAELVRRIYGFANPMKALARVAAAA